MKDDDAPITRAEFRHLVAEVNSQMHKVVREAVKEHAPAMNPKRSGGDPAAWAMVSQLQAEIRERDRSQLQAMQKELNEIRNQPSADPLEEIEHARALVAALGPEKDSQLMQGLGILSNLAEAYVEKSNQDKTAHSPATSDHAQPISEELGQPAESHDFEEHLEHGQAPAADGGFLVVEEPR
jgi:hypothetical protein